MSFIKLSENEASERLCPPIDLGLTAITPERRLRNLLSHYTTDSKRQRCCEQRGLTFKIHFCLLILNR